MNGDDVIFESGLISQILREDFSMHEKDSSRVRFEVFSTFLLYFFFILLNFHFLFHPSKLSLYFSSF